jgi:hypothetical protein
MTSTPSRHGLREARPDAVPDRDSTEGDRRTPSTEGRTASSIGPWNKTRHQPHPLQSPTVTLFILTVRRCTRPYARTERAGSLSPSIVPSPGGCNRRCASQVTAAGASEAHQGGPRGAYGDDLYAGPTMPCTDGEPIGGRPPGPSHARSKTTHTLALSHAPRST